jgi:hypothetical protein
MLATATIAVLDFGFLKSLSIEGLFKRTSGYVHAMLMMIDQDVTLSSLPLAQV